MLLDYDSIVTILLKTLKNNIEFVYNMDKPNISEIEIAVSSLTEYQLILSSEKTRDFNPNIQRYFAYLPELERNVESLRVQYGESDKTTN